VVGEYFADLMVKNMVADGAGLKVAEALDDFYRGQCFNFLKVTGLCLCLLARFGRSVWISYAL